MQKKLMAENKLLLLFLLYQMDIPMSEMQIAEFIIDGEYMDFFSFKKYLRELIDEELIKESYENDNTRYTITIDGEKVLDYFSKEIPNIKRTAVLDYTVKNRRRIKKEFSVTAGYFINREDDYLVKCGVYEDNHILMEINVSVPTKEDARMLKKNWKKNVSQIYGSVMQTLLSQPDAGGAKSAEIAENIDKKNHREK